MTSRPSLKCWPWPWQETVTLNAIGCQNQKELVWHIRSRQADYVLTVKENQPALRATLEEIFTAERAAQFKGCLTAHRTVNGGHERIEIRRGWTLGAPEYLQYLVPRAQWPDLRRLPLVETGTTRGRQGKHRNP